MFQLLTFDMTCLLLTLNQECNLVAASKYELDTTTPHVQMQYDSFVTLLRFRYHLVLYQHYLHVTKKLSCIRQAQAKVV